MKIERELLRGAGPIAVLNLLRSGEKYGYELVDALSKQSDGVLAMGGNAAVTGDPDRPPIRCTLPTAYYHAAPEAALGIAMALYAREQSGRGQHVDVSMQECQLSTLVTGAGQYALSGSLRKRTGPILGNTREIWKAKDGGVSFALRGGQARIPILIATVEYMAEEGMAPEWLRAYDWTSPSAPATS